MILVMIVMIILFLIHHHFIIIIIIIIIFFVFLFLFFFLNCFVHPLWFLPKVLSVRSFDTHANANNVTGQMYDYVAGLADGTIVLGAAKDSATGTLPDMYFAGAMHMIGSEYIPLLKRR